MEFALNWNTDLGMTAGKMPQQIGPAKIAKADFLRQRREFDYVRKEGTSYVGRYVVINIAPAPDDCVRLGIIVSRRFSRSAVDRNRGRRLIRESFRLLRNGIESPIWMVVIARHYLQGCKVQQVQDEFIRLLREADAFESPSDER